MAITNGYSTLVNYKLWFRDADAGTADDTVLEYLIESISRLIDDMTGTRFFSTNEARYYDPNDNYELYVDDFTAITTIKTDEDGDETYEYTWASDDFHEMPHNAALDGEPYRFIKVATYGTYTFPKGVTKSVEVTADFGYSTATPKGIEEACLMGSHRIMARHKTPLGTSASATFGQLSTEIKSLGRDPDFRDMLFRYTKRSKL